MKKNLCFIPMGLAVILWILGVSTSFGGDFYTEIYRAVYFGMSMICISIGLVGYIICSYLEKVSGEEQKAPAPQPQVQVQPVAPAPAPQPQVQVQPVAPAPQPQVQVQPVAPAPAPAPQPAAGPTVSSANAEQLIKAKNLLDNGIITKEEYDKIVAGLLR